MREQRHTKKRNLTTSYPFLPICNGYIKAGLKPARWTRKRRHNKMKAKEKEIAGKNQAWKNCKAKRTQNSSQGRRRRINAYIMVVDSIRWVIPYNSTQFIIFMLFYLCIYQCTPMRFKMCTHSKVIVKPTPKRLMQQA